MQCNTTYQFIVGVAGKGWVKEREMREILFRGKRVNGGEWVEGYFVKAKWYLDDRDVFAIIPTGVCFYPLCEIDEYIEVDPKTVCQYTGLTDKNGKKIFEGDIVKAVYKPQDKDLTIDNFIIKWDKYLCKFVGYYAEKENAYNPLLFGSQTSFEVIGNIFDNTDLLTTSSTDSD